MTRFFAHFLFILAAWTIVIKYLFPIGFAMAEGVPSGTYVYWDLWPVVHVLVGWSLLNWNRYTFPFAVGVSVVEIVIIVTKFAAFLAAPEWTIFRTNWFIVLLLGYLVLNMQRLRAAKPMPA
jgi:hypothetical protein